MLNPVVSRALQAFQHLGTLPDPKDTAASALVSGSADTPSTDQGAGNGAAESAITTLSSAAGNATATPTPAAVFAEIWRDGTKVAEVDANGNVTSTAGIRLPAMNDSGGGPAAAAFRAAQIARTVGGEVRSHGEPVSGRVLVNRANLQALYRS